MFKKKQREARIRIVKIDPTTDDAVDLEESVTIDPEKIASLVNDFVTHNTENVKDFVEHSADNIKDIVTHTAKVVGAVAAGLIVLSAASAIAVEKNKK